MLIFASLKFCQKRWPQLQENPFNFSEALWESRHVIHKHKMEKCCPQTDCDKIKSILQIISRRKFTCGSPRQWPGYHNHSSLATLHTFSCQFCKRSLPTSTKTQRVHSHGSNIVAIQLKNPKIKAIHY